MTIRVDDYGSYFFDDDDIEEAEILGDDNYYDEDEDEMKAREPTIFKLSEIEKAWDSMKKFAQNGGLHDYAFLMEHDGELKLYPRSGMPCYGAMRRYGDLHGDKCTFPREHRPNDLPIPFPEGKIRSFCVGFGIGATGIVADIRREFYGPDSPWISGFGYADNAEMLSHRNGGIGGLLLYSAEVDPTVLVSLLCISRASWTDNPEMFDKFVSMYGIDGFFKFSVTVAVGSLLNDNPPLYPSLFGPPTIGYYSPIHADYYRMSQAEPQRFTKGTWGQGYDYSRSDLANVFGVPLSKRERYLDKPTIITEAHAKFTKRDILDFCTVLTAPVDEVIEYIMDKIKTAEQQQKEYHHTNNTDLSAFVEPHIHNLNFGKSNQ